MEMEAEAAVEMETEVAVETATTVNDEKGEKRQKWQKR
jgi:hypothetical protein